MVVNIVLFLLFILFSAFFSASETALFSLSPVRMRRLQERYPQAKRVKQLLKRPNHLLSAIVFGNILVNIAMSSLATAVCVYWFGEKGLVLAIVVTTLAILLFGEILPKSLAIYGAEQFSLLSTPVLQVFIRIFAPLIYAVEKLVGYFSRFLMPSRRQAVFSEDELKTALVLGKRGGYITQEEEEMISYVLEFKDTWVSEILTARVDVEGIDIESSQEEVLRILRRKRHSKFPVYRDSLDNIVGILHAKDVFFHPEQDYRTLLKDPLLIPESKRIDDLLILFLKLNKRMAIVLDEYGGTSGIVTREDIEEEIVGELYDEFEVAREMIQPLGEAAYRVYGKTPLKNVNIELDLELPEDEDTLAGFLLSQMERIPRPGDRFVFRPPQGAARADPVTFLIERATSKRIVSVVIQK
ncbi:MAG: DUF21 domain-containing protein [Candidatus Omnitrophica bacterium]|nr:DUF21 domain-containing protein [Candidatus Omnitrophota bacterium]